MENTFSNQKKFHLHKNKFSFKNPLMEIDFKKNLTN
jgi:hypothetical protein